jgi:dihydrofolate reductase
MKLCLIVAVSRNGVIGLNNQLPWHLPEDLKYFKSVTMGKPIVMGRKTYDSIGRPLDAALELGATACDAAGAKEIMVIGGEQIYRMTLDAAERLYLTQVDAEVEGDAFFPEIDPKIWNQVSVQVPEKTDTHPYRFLILDRA